MQRSNYELHRSISEIWNSETVLQYSAKAQAADKAAEGYVGSQDKSALVDASTGLERPMEDSAGARDESGFKVIKYKDCESLTKRRKAHCQVLARSQEQTRNWK